MSPSRSAQRCKIGHCVKRGRCSRVVPRARTVRPRAQSGRTQQVDDAELPPPSPEYDQATASRTSEVEGAWRSLTCALKLLWRAQQRRGRARSKAHGMFWRGPRCGRGAGCGRRPLGVRSMPGSVRSHGAKSQRSAGSSRIRYGLRLQAAGVATTRGRGARDSGGSLLCRHLAACGGPGRLPHPGHGASPCSSARVARAPITGRWAARPAS